ncbi:MAG TPA: hypothetical protein VFX86_03130 [Candidatus Saccharimonadales bacterium]|nr:hypothetical protein [Candidatus Saccharimonadales bacterium]
MSEIKKAFEFGSPVKENGKMAQAVRNNSASRVPNIYPQAAERIAGLFDFRDESLVEVGRELRVNRSVGECDIPPVGHYPKSAAEAAERISRIIDDFNSEENVGRIYEAIIDSYLESAIEGPVPVNEMPGPEDFNS